MEQIKNELYKHGVVLENTDKYIFISGEDEEFEITINLYKKTIELYGDCVTLNSNVSKLLIKLFSSLDWGEKTTLSELKKDFKWQDITLETSDKLYSIYDDDFEINIKKDTNEIQIVAEEYIELSYIVSSSLVSFFKGVK